MIKINYRHVLLVSVETLQIGDWIITHQPFGAPATVNEITSVRRTEVGVDIETQTPGSSHPVPSVWRMLSDSHLVVARWMA